jgi:general secretion pathway protein F
MAVFEYKALNSQGRQVKGIIDSDSVRAARAKLNKQGIFPTSIVESLEKAKSGGWNKQISFKSQRVGPNQLSIATRQLATLLTAGMPLVDALKALGDQIEHPAFRTIFAEVTDNVNEGSSFAGSLKAYPKVFPRLYTNMVASGEASGSLDMVLERLADLLESQAALRRKVISALTYPTLMIVLCVGVIMLLLAFVVPQITEMFKDHNAALPLPTEIVIWLSDFVQSYWWLILGIIVGAVIGLKRYYSTTKGRLKIDSIKLRLPLVGAMTLKIATSRFSRNLSSMLSSGIDVLGALEIAKNIVGNTVIENAIESAREGVKEGQSLAKELSKTNLFPRLLIHMIAIGEKTGQLDSMLKRAADAYESEVDAFIGGLTSILEPLLIVFLAVVVGGILAAVMLPMLEMTSLAGA